MAVPFPTPPAIQVVGIPHGQTTFSGEQRYLAQRRQGAEKKRRREERCS